ncbi:ABC transporter permease [Streptomyces sp. NPDC005202]|uniref:ABC transporter permease n=1 Tax=Streptomyces sp. NPDC005202 TaxID=3157021 RepID=UPI0033ACA71F
MAGFAGFVLLRARAHRLLLAAALLTVLLTTAVLATLAAYSGAIGDSALRHSLRDTRNAADATLVVKADVPPARRAAADIAVRNRARAAFDGLPVTVRTLVRSGPYALPRSLQPPAELPQAPGSARAGDTPVGDPDLTHFAALDHTQVRIVAGRLPRRTVGDLEVALPQTAARRLGLRPGARLTLADRLGGPKVHVWITGLYRPAQAGAPYWQLDDLGGRGIRKVGFTTYGPLLADPGVLTGRQVSAGPSAWQASADFSALTTARIGALRTAVRDGAASLRKAVAPGSTPVVTTSLPDVLDCIDRSLLVSRSTLLIAALQLALLAGYALQVAQPAPPEITAVATDGFLASTGARSGQRVDVTFGGRNLPVRIVRSVRALPTTAGAGDGTARDGGALVADLRSVNRVLEVRHGESVVPTEWWLRTAQGDAAQVAAAVRSLPDVDPAQVVVRDEIAAQLRDDPFGVGPAAAFTAAAVVAALAAVGFAVSAAGALRARGAEFAVLRALGAPRRQLARMIAAEQRVLATLALVVGVALGAVLTRAVIPLIVLTAQARKPVPRMLVELPAARVAVLLAAVAVAPLAVTAALTLRRADPATSLRDGGGE